MKWAWDIFTHYKFHTFSNLFSKWKQNIPVTPSFLWISHSMRSSKPVFRTRQMSWYLQWKYEILISIFTGSNFRICKCWTFEKRTKNSMIFLLGEIFFKVHSHYFPLFYDWKKNKCSAYNFFMITLQFHIKCLQIKINKCTTCICIKALEWWEIDLVSRYR